MQTNAAPSTVNTAARPANDNATPPARPTAFRWPCEDPGCLACQDRDDCENAWPRTAARVAAAA